MFTSKKDFDFKVVILRHIETVEQGKQISIPYRLDLLRGEKRDVDLDVNTRWDSVGLTAKLVPNKLTPSQPWTGTVMIKASATTPLGSYLFTVRGGTEGTWNTSEDAVTVVVEPKDNDKKSVKDEGSGNEGKPTNQESAPGTERFETARDSSIDPSDLFKPSAEARSAMAKISSLKANNGISLGVWLAVGFAGFVIIMVLVMMNIGGTTRRCIINVFNTTPPDCSDNNGRSEHTYLNNHDIGMCSVPSNSGCARR